MQVQECFGWTKEINWQALGSTPTIPPILAVVSRDILHLPPVIDEKSK